MFFIRTPPNRSSVCGTSARSLDLMRRSLAITLKFNILVIWRTNRTSGSMDNIKMKELKIDARTIITMQDRIVATIIRKIMTETVEISKKIIVRSIRPTRISLSRIINKMSKCRTFYIKGSMSSLINKNHKNMLTSQDSMQIIVIITMRVA